MLNSRIFYTVLFLGSESKSERERERGIIYT